jgi:hypothetical protein
MMSSGKTHVKKREKKVRFGGDEVVATKYIIKDPKKMHTIYKIYDEHGRHVGSKREWAKIMELYKTKPVDKVQEHKSMLQKRKFYEMMQQRRQTKDQSEKE